MARVVSVLPVCLVAFFFLLGCNHAEASLYTGKIRPCNKACPFHIAPVCGSNGVTYYNECLLNAVRDCYLPSLRKVSDGACGPSRPCNKACPFHIAYVCGSNGVTYDNECLLNSQRDCYLPSLRKLWDGPCGKYHKRRLDEAENPEENAGQEELD